MLSNLNNTTKFQSIKNSIEPNITRSSMRPKEIKKKEWKDDCAYLAYCSDTGDWDTIGCPQYGMHEYTTACRDILKVFSYNEDLDENYWMMSGKLKDGSVFYFKGGCDYSGFDCHGGGVMHLASSWENLFDNLDYSQLMDFVRYMSEDNTLALTKSLVQFIYNAKEKNMENLRSKLKDIFSLLKK